jgi:5-methyltetrahydrofolate--homocysteine methyltransferase
METRVSSASQEVLIGDNRSTVLIGERINPSGKKKLSEALKEQNFDVIREEARTQVEAGADILDVNVVTSGVNEVVMLPKVVEVVLQTVKVPLCLDINNPSALKEALKIYPGKPIVNSVSGEEKSLNEVLPLVKEYGTAVIGLTLDDDGIPKEAGKRVEIADKIIERAESIGIPREDVIIDGLALSIGSDSHAGTVTLETIRRVRDELGVNQNLGASNVSFGLPNRTLLNQIFLALAIANGLTCPTVNVAKVRSAILAADLALGRDRYAMRYIQDFRKSSGA